ncbi:MAG: dTDP-4-dehydrorhamnose 3,5-epimerase family protein [Patescibacteria group bacterium]|nr:dTDP-4-dehydrorhamnose 3,5-epimerase family protein [Patescibacteria group bacterium]
MKNLNIIDKIKNKIFIQDYSKKPIIEGVKIFDIKRFFGEDGIFEEVTRINENGCLEVFPEFKLRQINRSKILAGAVKAWHIHYYQEDIWYIGPEDHMILGLWDLRENSLTKDLKMRIVMGATYSKLVYIPRGVAHGVVNISNKEGTIIYFVNNQFNFQDPDERRLPWDIIGTDFWQPEKG